MMFNFCQKRKKRFFHFLFSLSFEDKETLSSAKLSLSINFERKFCQKKGFFFCPNVKSEYFAKKKKVSQILMSFLKVEI